MATLIFSRSEPRMIPGFLLWLALWGTPDSNVARADGAGCRLDPPTPAVTLAVRVRANGAPGQELEYRITAENRTLAAAHNVLVRNPLPDNVKFVRANPEPSAKDPELQWRLGTLEACARREIMLVVVPTGSADVTNCARVQFEHGQCVTTKIAPTPLAAADRGSAPAQPEIQLRKYGPVQAMVNDILRFELAVTNTGASPLKGVRVTDSLPPGMEHESKHNALSWEVGSLAPGESRTMNYQVVAKAAGKLCNRAAAVAAGDIRDVVESCVTVTQANLSLKIDGPAKQYLNNTLAYQLLVSNTGSVPIENVYVINPIPDHTDFIRASDAGQRAGNQVQWVLGTLEPRARRTVEVVLRSQAPGKICNRATASAGDQYSVEAEACTELIGVAALLLEVVDTEDPVEVGSETMYIINIRNQGTAQATNIQIEAIVPAQMEILRVTGPSDHKKEGQRIICEPLTMAAKGEARYVVYVRAKTAGEVRFKVNMTADQLTSGLPVHEEESTTIYSSNPSLGK